MICMPILNFSKDIALFFVFPSYTYAAATHSANFIADFFAVMCAKGFAVVASILLLLLGLDPGLGSFFLHESDQLLYLSCIGIVPDSYQWGTRDQQLLDISIYSVVLTRNGPQVFP
jgi:hypothetical protein